MDDANESNITTTPSSSSSRIALSQSSHPVACMFHCFFQKLAALVLYIYLEVTSFPPTSMANPQWRQIHYRVCVSHITIGRRRLGLSKT
jgi:hypothetical protein